jgi:DNA mismatch repair protein MutS
MATIERARPKTLFATHYHELTDLADAIPGVVNAHVTAREWKDDIIFLHKILPGRSDRSYGIQVARLAGLPATVIARARDILASLEHDELARGGKPSLSGVPVVPQQQLGLFQTVSPADEKLRERIREVDINRTTPIDALQILQELKTSLE